MSPITLFRRQYKQKIVDESLRRTRVDFYRNAMDVKGFNITRLAKISGVARQTLYNIINGETSPDTATFKKIADSLDIDPSILIRLNEEQDRANKEISVHERNKYIPLLEKLLEVAKNIGMTKKEIIESLIFLRKSWLFRYRKHETSDYSSFICDVNYPDDSIVYVNQMFPKKWSIQNMGDKPWKNRKLVCVDKMPNPYYDKNDGYSLAENNRLVPLQREVPIPDTMPGSPVTITAPMKAPPLPCTAFSYWKMYDEHGEVALPDQIGIWCRVIVVSI